MRTHPYDLLLAGIDQQRPGVSSGGTSVYRPGTDIRAEGFTMSGWVPSALFWSSRCVPGPEAWTCAPGPDHRARNAACVALQRRPILNRGLLNPLNNIKVFLDRIVSIDLVRGLCIVLVVKD